MSDSAKDRFHPVYPVAVGPTGRYLVDQAGVPFLVQGDAAWSMVAAATREDAACYLDDAQAKGTNSIIVNAIEAYFAPDPPRNAYGEEPFRTPGDFSTPNEAYFAHLDWLIGAAGDRGIQVFLVPSYLGYVEPGLYAPRYGYELDRPDGWFAEVLENGVEGCRDYGRFLGRRYRDFDNIVWVMGGDRNPGMALEHVRAMAAGILDEDDRHLLTAHVNPEDVPVEQYPDDPWLAMNFTYSYTIVHKALLRDYCRVPVRPNILVESTYEFDHNASDLQIRRQAYWSLLCGACGQFMGTDGVWGFAPGWQDVLDSPGRVAVSRLVDVFSSRRWWDLVPDLGRAAEWSALRSRPGEEFVRQGVGELRGLDFCAAARTPDGALAMAYIPTARTVTLDLSQMADGSVSATWFDPTSGAMTAGGEWPTGAIRDFSPPGDHDWLLILEAV
jgi:hypothetical protein